MKINPKLRQQLKAGHKPKPKGEIARLRTRLQDEGLSVAIILRLVVKTDDYVDDSRAEKEDTTKRRKEDFAKIERGCRDLYRLFASTPEPYRWFAFIWGKNIPEQVLDETRRLTDSGFMAGPPMSDHLIDHIEETVNSSEARRLAMLRSSENEEKLELLLLLLKEAEAGGRYLRKNLKPQAKVHRNMARRRWVANLKSVLSEVEGTSFEDKRMVGGFSLLSTVVQVLSSEYIAVTHGVQYCEPQPARLIREVFELQKRPHSKRSRRKRQPR